MIKYIAPLYILLALAFSWVWFLSADVKTNNARWEVMMQNSTQDVRDLFNKQVEEKL